MKLMTRSAENLNLITYLRYAVGSGLDSFAAPSYLEFLHQAVKVFAGLICALLIALLIVARDMIGLHLLAAGIILAPTAYVIAVLTTRMVIEAVIAVFIVNDNVMMIRRGLESVPAYQQLINTTNNLNGERERESQNGANN